MMTHIEEIMRAVAKIVNQDDRAIFTRKQIREQIGIDQDTWMSGYTAIFQGMRFDHPGRTAKFSRDIYGSLYLVLALHYMSLTAFSSTYILLPLLGGIGMLISNDNARGILVWWGIFFFIVGNLLQCLSTF